MASKNPAPRDVVQFYYKDKMRTGIIVTVDEEERIATVLYGTRTQREQVCIPLPAGRPSANMIGLHSTTYFYPENSLHVDYDVCRMQGKRCPPGLIVELRSLLKLRLLENKPVHHYAQAEHAEALSADTSASANLQ